MAGAASARVLAAILHVALVSGQTGTPCDVRARTDSGWLCGLRRHYDNTSVYASFRGVPYAKQPLGELRFKELQPAEPWDGYLNAIEEGPSCPQDDSFYGKLRKPWNMSEACIYANIHVPIHALPEYRTQKLLPPYRTGAAEEDRGLPILVFIHGGGFAFGSGDADLHGPEYMVAKNVIVITFNYRLNVFGFLSLNSTDIPGNNGLRDMVTLLCWVKNNAQYFGGNPDDITLGGQSAGAVAAHLLALSPVAEGLFNKVILMSGTAQQFFYTTSPIYAQFAANLFLTQLGINYTDPEAHSKLTKLPLEDIMKANSNLQQLFGLVVFFPVVETPLPNVTTIIDQDPDIQVQEGRGKHIPTMVGFTNKECESFRPRFEDIDMVSRITANPLLLVPADLIYKMPVKQALGIAKKIALQYFNGKPNIDGYIQYCSDIYYVYPTLRLARTRNTMDGAPMYLYQFSYNSDFSVMKEALGLKFNGSSHVEDMSYVLRANEILGPVEEARPSRSDALMVHWMTQFVDNFMRCGTPTCGAYNPPGWPPVSYPLRYQDIMRPNCYVVSGVTDDQHQVIAFFDRIYKDRT